MSTRLPGNLEEIFPLRLQMKDGIVFSFQPDKILAVRTSDREQFLLKRWQYELLTRLDGKNTFEEASREVYRQSGGAFSAVGLLNFYNWLYNEDIVMCNCASVFELVVDEAEETGPSRTSSTSMESSGFEIPEEEEPDKPVPLASRVWRNQTARRALTASAIVAFSLAVLRIGYVASPIVLSPAQKAYAEWKDARTGGPDMEATSEKLIPDSSQSELQLSGKAVETPEAPEPEAAPQPAVSKEIPEVLDIPEVPELEEKEEKASAPATPKDLEEEMDDLRRELAGCRVRRDEFYIQNDEAGYRREVERMIRLAKRIGELEAKL